MAIVNMHSKIGSRTVLLFVLGIIFIMTVITFFWLVAGYFAFRAASRLSVNFREFIAHQQQQQQQSHRSAMPNSWGPPPPASGGSEKQLNEDTIGYRTVTSQDALVLEA
ncbi:hypothetical protein BGZ94_007591 [Podila epigama]|nr:hypothetical protein BGZ94_007591 [Podila epigama]